MPLYLALDPFPYDQDPRSCRIHSHLPDGLYVYVQDVNGEIWVAPDGPHQHPKVLGGGRPALYAGDLTIDQRRIADLTNLSGTFQCDDENGLLAIQTILVQQGWVIVAGGVRFFPTDGGLPIRLA